MLKTSTVNSGRIRFSSGYTLKYQSMSLIKCLPHPHHVQVGCCGATGGGDFLDVFKEIPTEVVLYSFILQFNPNATGGGRAQFGKHSFYRISEENFQFGQQFFY